jgi:hypothetical protein
MSGRAIAFAATIRVVRSLPLKGGGLGWGSGQAWGSGPAWGSALLLFCLAMPACLAQPASAAEPILRVTVDPPRVIVGQSTVLQVDVLAPNYMTKPPVAPDFQLRNAVTRAGSTINMSEQHDGTTYAGVRFEFLIYPQEPGSYAVDGQKVSITYAAEPPATREAELKVPRIAFEAFIPDGAQALDPFVSATALELKQEIRKSSDALKVGDSVIRTVTIAADGIPAMLLPPVTFVATDGAKIYPAQPDLQDRFDRRTDRLSSTRVDEATYMLERPGDFNLPAVELAWWSVRGQRIERARIEPVVLQVADDPSLKADAGSAGTSPSRLRSVLAYLADHWLIALMILAALAVVAWITPGAVRALLAWNRKRREAYRASERCAFADLEAAARSGDAGKTYFALLAWLQRFARAGPAHTIASFKAAARDPELDREIAVIEQCLFARNQVGPAWNGRNFSRQVASARRRWLGSARADTPALPIDLNPRPAISKAA